MYLSLNLLNQYVDIKSCNISNKEYAEKMTMSGSKVEYYKNKKDNYKNIITGKIVKISKHENAENLYICEIDIKKEKPITIITGAKNIKQEDIVPIALNNAILPDGTIIKSKDLRGIKSEGMMCSIKELNLNIDYFENVEENGILILDKNTEIGEEFAKSTGLDDTIIEFEITSNRPDCMSVLGLARETSATFNLPVKYEKLEENNKEDKIKDYLSVEVESKNCHRYMAKVVKNVKVQPSPLWLKRVLLSHNMSPINNIVDITNYILLLYGQPMHAFCYDSIKSKKIVVSQIQEDIKFKMLDKKEVNVPKDSIIIKDDKEPIAIAGIMGGLESSITEKTKTVVFECASFNYENIIKTSKSIDVKTDSSYLFEKGLDPNNCEKAILHACKLVKELGCGEVVEGIIDVYKNKQHPLKIDWDINFINKFLGCNINEEEMKSIAQKLGFIIEEGKIIIPTYRNDVTTKWDLAEEIARIYGYDNIPLEKIKSDIVTERNEEEEFLNKLNNIFLSNGFYEIITYSFIGTEDYEKINSNIDKESENFIKLVNPMGETSSIMRTTLIPSMLKIISLNYNNRNSKAKLYEISSTYKAQKDEKLAIEEKQIIAGLFGENYDFYTLKSVLEDILKAFKIENAEFEEEKENSAFHTGICSKVYINKEYIGVIGQVHPIILKNYEINTKVYIFDINFNKILKNRKDTQITYKPISKFPSITRDIGLLCSVHVNVGFIEKIIKQSLGDILESIKMFDLYTGDKVEKGKKSVAFKLVLRSSEKTLTDKEIESLMNKTMKNLEDNEIVLRLQ